MNAAFYYNLVFHLDSDDFGIYKLSNDLEKEINKLDGKS